MDVVEQSGQSFAEDVYNTVMEACSDGFDALIRIWEDATVANPEGTDGKADAGPNSVEIARVREGLQRVHDTHIRRAAASLGLFAHCCASVFQPPVIISVPQMEGVLLPSSTDCGGSGDEHEREQQLARRVESLRLQVAQVDGSCTEMCKQLEVLDWQVSNSGDIAEYSALAAAATSQNTTVLAIMEGARKLQAYMDNASQLRESLNLPGAQQKQVDITNLDTTATASVALALQLFSHQLQPEYSNE